MTLYAKSAIVQTTSVPRAQAFVVFAKKEILENDKIMLFAHNLSCALSFVNLVFVRA
jgi:hypothetical protein